MNKIIKKILKTELANIKEHGLYKSERIILTPQSSHIKVKEGEVINFCANNYLGLSSNAQIIEAAKKGLDEYGYGMSSVRFICGTQSIHKKLEQKIAEFFKTDDTILYSSCFDANGGLFETILTPDDTIISDELNHASIIDGVRLCKAERRRYKHASMEDLEKTLKETIEKRINLIATDGVFSMDGDLAPLDKICELSEKYEALVMIDDSHATGFVGKTGRGTAEHFNVLDKIDIITSTMGKALGGASGGFTTGRKEIIEYLRQRSRPYLFSNSLAPPIVTASIAAFDLLTETTELRDKLEQNTLYFRQKIKDAGFQIKEGIHPIVPIMLGEAKLASDIADDLLKQGIYVIGFSYPVVPKGQARIRVQLSALHTKEQIDKAVDAFYKIGKKYGIVK